MAPQTPVLAVRSSAKSFVILACAAVIVAFAQSGCVGTRFGVDGIKNKRVAEQKVSYVVRSANPAVPETSAEFQREAAFVKTALSSKGFYEAPPGAPVDMVVEIDCGMEAPKTKLRTRREEITVFEPGRSEVVGGTSSDGTMTNRTVYTPPRTTVVGEREVTESVTTYPKFLRITARETPEAAGDHPPREVWSVYVTNEDRSDDLEGYVPLLVAAGMDQVNEETSGEIRTVLKPQDDRVKFVKKGM